MEIIAIRIEKAIKSKKMIKKGLKKTMTNFLQMSDKLSSKKKRQINKNKQKTSIGKISSRKATINSLDSSNQKELSILLEAIKTLEPKAKDINIAIISTNAYCTAYCLKRV